MNVKRTQREAYKLSAEHRVFLQICRCPFQSGWLLGQAVSVEHLLPVLIGNHPLLELEVFALSDAFVLPARIPVAGPMAIWTVGCIRVQRQCLL